MNRFPFDYEKSVVNHNGLKKKYFFLVERIKQTHKRAEKTAINVMKFIKNFFFENIKSEN